MSPTSYKVPNGINYHENTDCEQLGDRTAPAGVGGEASGGGTSCYERAGGGDVSSISGKTRLPPGESKARAIDGRVPQPWAVLRNGTVIPLLSSTVQARSRYELSEHR